MRLTEEKKCPICGSRHLRGIEDDDPVFLMDTDAFTAESVQDILRQNGVPCQLQGLMGAGIIMRLGYAFETYRIFVPYGEYERTKELLGNFFENQEEE